MIKAIIFDLADVLLTGIRDMRSDLAQKHGIVTEPGSRPLFVTAEEEFFHGNISEDEYLNEVLQKYPEIGSKKDLKNHIRENFREIEGTREIILTLKSAGYKLALISVHGKEWIEDCQQRFNHHDLFDIIAYSYEDKVSKPNRKAYELVVARLGVRPEECIFIDDSLINVESAKDLGIVGIQFFDANQLRSELRRLNILS